VPKQNSSGGKQNLLGISKRGDSYLRTLLIHGSRSVIRYANNSDNRWLASLSERRNKNVVAVALANKNARIAWALLAKNTRFDGNYVLSCC
jgi:transposase